MPITKQAAKKMRSDRSRNSRNKKVRETAVSATKLMRKSPSVKNLSNAFKTLDKAAKRGIIHTNKAARLKARLAKLIAKK